MEGVHETFEQRRLLGSGAARDVGAPAAARARCTALFTRPQWYRPRPLPRPTSQPSVKAPGAVAAAGAPPEARMLSLSTARSAGSASAASAAMSGTGSSQCVRGRSGSGAGTVSTVMRAPSSVGRIRFDRAARSSRQTFVAMR
jgi:hypothetical protein